MLMMQLESGKQIRQWLTRWLLLVGWLLLLSVLGCESKLAQTQASVASQISTTEQTVADLGQALSQQQLHNAQLLRAYSDALQEQQPKLAEIARIIGQDSSTQGPLYQGLITRLADVKTAPVTLESSAAIFNELAALQQAARPSIFNDALTDPINVLADMSQGQLARVGSISQQAQGDNGQSSAGSQLVGNPSYGHWQSQSDGTSFWQWYGMYRLLGDVIGRVSYANWSQKRHYSYYSDYGRSRYTSPVQRQQQTAVDNRTRKQFARSGRAFNSPYAKTRRGASGLSRASYTPSRTQSSYGKSTRKSNTGSLRDRRSRTSRGVSRGK